MTEYRVIDTAEGFHEAIEALQRGQGPLGVDVERASGFRYSQRAYLVQVFRRDAGAFLFDPPAIGDFTSFQDAFGETEWVLHAASQDLPSLHELGLYPAVIFDTELAARLLGHERVGLGAIVEEELGIVLAKAHSADDWSTRPLPQSWLEYAALDVVHLIDLRDKLVAELDQQHKTEFAREEFAAARDKPERPAREDPWRRLSGLHTLRGRRNLAIARSLWQAREDFAREQDIAPGRLVPDRSLVAAIRSDPQSKAQLAGNKEFNGRASRTQLDRWWAAIEAGRAVTTLPPDRLSHSDSVPPPRVWADRNPAADARYKQARPAVEAHAEELNMPTENLLTPDFLRRISWDHPGDDVTAISQALADLGARSWQIAETAPLISRAFVESVQGSSQDAATDS
ncbi:ribonuclease D [Microbacterium gorillae]|uniref:ribonuclease D n=1 Tax=Microbacterium gorillae TaxID=1231063 RepID=UPI00058DEE56|nr:HRDC domain-containing protein [Microbacterium gorillae]